jgi:mannose-6-phosphate isomerase
VTRPEHPTTPRSAANGWAESSQTAQDVVMVDALANPLTFEPILVPKPWGGRRLERFNHVLPPAENAGESWEIADLDPAAVSSVSDPTTRVSEGSLQGRSLRDLIALNRDALLGEATDHDGRFPLLIKLLDAREHLSVQVHPPAAYAVDDPSIEEKTESWIVLDAEPGAELMVGTTNGTTRQDVVEAIGTPDIVALLRRVPAVTGSVHHIPAGTIHALGAGVLVAEVQTPSDSTYRLYDWTAEYGRAPRSIHTDEAARCLELAWPPPDPGPIAEPASTGTLVQTPHYVVRRHVLGVDDQRDVAPGIVRVVLITEGVLEVEGFAKLRRRGQVLLLPAAWSGRLRARTACRYLDVTPTALRRDQSSKNV